MLVKRTSTDDLLSLVSGFQEPKSPSLCSTGEPENFNWYKYTKFKSNHKNGNGLKSLIRKHKRLGLESQNEALASKSHWGSSLCKKSAKTAQAAVFRDCLVLHKIEEMIQEEAEETTAQKKQVDFDFLEDFKPVACRSACTMGFQLVSDPEISTEGEEEEPKRELSKKRMPGQTSEDLFLLSNTINRLSI